MYVSKNCLQKKGLALRGFLATCSSVKKNVYKFAKQTIEAFKNVAALTKGREIELSFTIIFPFVTLATDFFVFFKRLLKESR